MSYKEHKKEIVSQKDLYFKLLPCVILSIVFMYSSMTSLLAYTVAQPTKWRFLPKNLNQLVIFVIGLAFTWV